MSMRRARAVLLIARADLRSTLRPLVRRPELLIALVIIVPLGGVPLTIACVAGGWVAGAHGATQPVLADAYLGLSVLYLVVGLSPTLGRFFTGRTLLLLLTAPLRPDAILAAGLLASIGPTVLVWWPLLALSAGIGLGAGAGPLFFVVAIVLAIAWPLALTAAQVGFLSVVLRTIPAARVRTATVVLSILMVIGVWLIQLALFGQSRGTIGRLSAIGPGPTWVAPAQALAALAAGSVGEAALWLLVALGAMGLVMILTAPMYGAALTVAATTPAAAPARRRRPRAERPAARSGAAAPLAAMLAKDWRLLRRDPRRLMALLPATMFGMVWPVWQGRNLRGAGVGAGSGFLLLLVLFSFIPFMLSTPTLWAIPAEREGFQLLRLAPRTPGWVLRAKLLVTLPPMLALATACTMLASTVLALDLAHVALALTVVLWLALGLGVIGVSAGAMWPNLNPANTRQPLNAGGQFAFLVIDGAFCALSAAGIGGLAFGLGGQFPLLAAAGVTLVGCALIVTSASVPVAMLLLARRRLRNLEPTVGA